MYYCNIETSQAKTINIDFIFLTRKIGQAYGSVSWEPPTPIHQCLTMCDFIHTYVSVLYILPRVQFGLKSYDNVQRSHNKVTCIIVHLRYITWLSLIIASSIQDAKYVKNNNPLNPYVHCDDNVNSYKRILIFNKYIRVSADKPLIQICNTLISHECRTILGAGQVKYYTSCIKENQFCLPLLSGMKL